MLNIDDPTAPQPRWPLLTLAFRPFFLLGALFSIIAVGIWVSFIHGIFNFTPHVTPLWWHAHEMIFGFIMAVIVGFLLTASQTWTNRPSISGIPLGLLVLVWLIPRVLLLNSHWLPLGVTAAIDLIFAPLVAISLAKQIIPSKQWHNMAFIVILSLLTLTNALSYYGAIIGDNTISTGAFHAAVLLMVTMVTIVGGRVIPFFTERATQWKRPDKKIWLEKLTFISIALLFIALLVNWRYSSILMFITGAALLVRWSFWGGRHSLKVPLLWSLHLSYLFIPIGFFITALGFNYSAGLHSMTVGGLGGVILAMISRVSLGHTGRKMIPPKPMIIAFVMILLAAVFRISASFFPTLYSTYLSLAAITWIIAYGSFIFCYSFILSSPRIDGRPS